MVRADLATRIFIVFVLTSVIATLSLLTVLTVQNYQRGRDNRETLTQLETQSALIRSCTTPGMPCFRDAQARTGAAVDDINHVVILAAACAVGQTGAEPAVEARIQRCVIDRLAREHASH